MGKVTDFGPKAISKRIKAKGLQKLKFYCEMCEKQCRDDNGFKCHCMSEGHLRQMEIFGQNSNGIVDAFSKEFEDAFLEQLRRCHGPNTRVAATVVYNEYIADRHHTHMNATQWATLTEFVAYLGTTGKCRVEDTPKGLFVTYNVVGSEALFQEDQRCKRLKGRSGEAVRHEREVLKQIDRAASVVEGVSVPQHHVVRPEGSRGQKIAFALGSVSSARTVQEKGVCSEVFQEDTVDPVHKNQSRGGLSTRVVGAKRSALDVVMTEEEEEDKDRKNRKSYWLVEGIVVKVIDRSLEKQGFYKRKGVVRMLVDRYVGQVEMLDTKHVLEIHQKGLETVIPQVGGLATIVNGSYRGYCVRVLALDAQKYLAKVKLEKCVYEGRVLPEVPSEDICQLAH